MHVIKLHDRVCVTPYNAVGYAHHKTTSATFICIVAVSAL